MATATVVKKKRTGVASSSIGLKILMAVTGLVFVLYVLLHMYGNLKALAGQEAFDTYAEHLRSFGEPMLPHGGLLWMIRALLILSLIGHAYAAFALWSRANAARSQRYAVKKAVASSLASRTMRWGGLALLAFIIFHLVQFTLVKPDLYAGSDAAAIKASPFVMISAAFGTWWVLLIYVLAMVALGMHVYHGGWSAAQTLGLTSSPAARQRAKTIAAVLSALLVIGFLIPPFALFLDLV